METKNQSKSTAKKPAAKPKKPAAKPTSKPKPEKAPDLSKVSVEGVPEATVEAAKHCVKNGFHTKLRAVVKDLPADNAFKVAALAKADAMDAEYKAKKKTEAKKKSKAVKRVTPDQILDKYDELHDLLAEFESQERAIKKPFRHAVVARRRIEVFKGAFKRNCG